ncbi:MAG: WbqC family protein [Pseudomonadales bacterium]|nr:WbqC family protein [Pseudomonadales bacterium]MBO6822649.1 WbqC family protein [Pseudomonadales bacterium]
MAIMQPYWIPYPGYFRLFKAADTFIVLDDVQHPRRGYVHRNQLLNHEDNLDWFTLPIKKASRDVQIRDLEFKPDAEALLKKQKSKFPILKDGLGVLEDHINLDQPVIETLINTLKTICCELRLDCSWHRSSDIGESHLKGPDRILALVKSMQGSRYVNLAGGVDLYDPKRFYRSQVDLAFLEPWEGQFISILQYMFSDDRKKMIRKMIDEQSVL